MLKSSKRLPIQLVLLSAILTLPFCGLCQQDEYPWVHYFDTPGCADNPSIHFAFADTEGNVIVSTGDWVRDYRWVDRIYYNYREGGVYRINEDLQERIEAPENTYVRDVAVDGEGTAWIMYAEASDYWYMDLSSRQGGGGGVLTGLGYGRNRFPHSPSAGAYGGLGEMRFATIQDGDILELPDVTEGIPAVAEGICIDPQGRVFVMSREWHPWEITAYFISWWRTTGQGLVRLLDLWDIIPHSWLGDYPHFGPDGLAYFLIEYSRQSAFGYEYAMLSLDPETEEYLLYDETEYSLLDSEVQCFYLDPLNIKWFGTEDGLVRFDGQRWTRWTTQNSALPYNLVRQMVYDEIDDVYYVISEREVGWDTFVLFSTLSPTGEAIGDPFALPTVPDPGLQLSKIHRDARGVFWLCPYGESTVYSYDHERVMQWNATDWMEMVDNVHYVGSTASGRTFCVAGKYSASCVMIW